MKSRPALQRTPNHPARSSQPKPGAVPGSLSIPAKPHARPGPSVCNGPSTKTGARWIAWSYWATESPKVTHDARRVYLGSVVGYLDESRIGIAKNRFDVRSPHKVGRSYYASRRPRFESRGLASLRHKIIQISGRRNMSIHLSRIHPLDWQGLVLWVTSWILRVHAF